MPLFARRIDAGLVRLATAALLLALCAGGCAGARPAAEAHSVVHGSVAPGWEEVAAEFEKSFAERDEIGAAVAVYFRGEKVVDLWGGHRDPDRTLPWDEDTMAVVFSTTKGLGAMTLAVANARGWLDYDAPVARYWPEFAQNGKAAITVRQLLAHQAGLVLLDEDLPVERVHDLDAVAALLARQKPLWEPGSRHGYHASTIGLYMNELLRRVDPQHRSLGRFFQEEIARPLGGLDFYIGLPSAIPDERLATIKMISPARGLFNLGKLPGGVRAKLLWPWSLFNRSLGIPSGYDPNARRSLAVELAAGNGVGTARAIARAYSAFATGGADLQLGPATLEQLAAAPVDPPAGPEDEVMGIDTWFSLGFLKPSPAVDFGTSRRTIASAGAGGSFALADPDRQLAYAYVMNRMDYYLSDDPRERSLRDAAYRCAQRLTGASTTRTTTAAAAAAPSASQGM